MMDPYQTQRPPEMALPPAFWGVVSQDDKNEFIRLRTQFHQAQKISSKDRRIVTFRKELLIVLKFLERSPENLEARSILTGVCFAGPIVCVNTRQLKAFLSRCKSSINGSFQQLGYIALRTKAKARECILAVLPQLQSQPNILRQWTVRVVSSESLFCFVSSFSNVYLPEITADDLFEDKRNAPPPAPTQFMPIQPVQVGFFPTAPMRPRQIAFELPTLQEFELEESLTSAPPPQPITTSFSVDTFQDYDCPWDDTPMMDDVSSIFERVSSSNMTRSVSFQASENWSFLDGF